MMKIQIGTVGFQCVGSIFVVGIIKPKLGRLLFDWLQTKFYGVLVVDYVSTRFPSAHLVNFIWASARLAASVLNSAFNEFRRTRAAMLEKCTYVNPNSLHFDILIS